MRFIYLYDFKGTEATFTVEAVDQAEADERFAAMKLAVFEGTVVYEIPIDDSEMRRINRNLH